MSPQEIQKPATALRALLDCIRWPFNALLNLWGRVLIAALTSGPIPAHIAFVMDGNRRYAKRKGILVREGHFAGFVNLQQTWELCFRLGVHSVSAYIFSIENFKRSQTEVNDLMEIFEERFTSLYRHGEFFEKYGVRVHFLGNISLLPQGVRDSITNLEVQTQHHDKANLNIMISYTSRDEVTRAVQSTVQHFLDKNLDSVHITEKKLESMLSTAIAGSPPVDIHIRTSGVKHFSDFMNWQCCEDTQIHFTPTHWPAFGFSDFVPILLAYQRKVWSRRDTPRRSDHNR